MATEFRLPEVSENVEKATVVSVLVSAGDSLKKEQPVVEIETEKATLEVPCSVGGIIKEVRVKEGDEINVGDVILTVEEGAGGKAKTEENQPEEGQEKKKEEKAQAEKRKEQEEKQEAAKRKKGKKAEAVHKEDEEEAFDQV